MRTVYRRICLTAVIGILLAGSSWGGTHLSKPALDSDSVPRLTFTKTMKGSVPEYVAITVDATGKGTYDGRKLDDPSSPRSLQLSAATTQQLFALAKQLSNFQSIDLESHKRVANLGLKILVYQGEGQTNRVEFNYTQNRVGQDITDIFEKISSVEQHIAALQFALRYDHLGLPHELQLIQIDLDNQALVDPQLMVPLLQEIAQNSRVLHLAQSRAQDILRRLQAAN